MPAFHHLTVARIQPQTDDAITITFDVPVPLKPAYRFHPGQHLTLRATVDGESLRRCYSICSTPQDDALQIAVRILPQGRFSSFLYHHLQPGCTVEVMEPQGQFGYQPQPQQRGHYLAVAAGSGITPLLSIIKSTLQREKASQFTLIYGNRTLRSVMFLDAITDLKNRYPQRLQIFWLFSQEDTGNALLSGHIDADNLQRLDHLLAFNQFHHAFLCGPAGMMANAQQALQQAGLPASRIHREQFQQGNAAPPMAVVSEGGQRVEIQLDGRRRAVILQAGDRSILDAALRQGLDLPYACKGGVCATCKCRLVSGAVSMSVNYSLEADQVAAGYILSCQSLPKDDDVMLDFDV